MALATTSDIETRLGRSLTAAEEAFCSAALDEVASMIAEEVGQDDDWAAALTPVPLTLRSLAVTAVVRAGQNPEGVISEQESLGQYSKNVRFPDPGDAGTSLMLTDAEGRLARRVVNGPGSSTARLPGIIDELPEMPLPVQYNNTPLADEDDG